MTLLTESPVWNPSASRVANARITRFVNWLRESRGMDFAGYEDLWAWSVNFPGDFWAAVWDHFDIVAQRRYDQVSSTDDMPETRWFEGARLNFADQVFRHRHLNTPALICASEDGTLRETSRGEFERQVAALARKFRSLGVKPGDRVAAFLPNTEHAVIAMLASSSVGAVWSIASPDMGPVAVGERFRQIEPKILICCDGYRYSGRDHSRLAALNEILQTLPSVEVVVWVPHQDPAALPPEQTMRRTCVQWKDAISGHHALEVQPLPSSHPLWILYSSGTSGLPKAIVHGHGGITLNGIMTTAVHGDIHAGDRVLWISSTSWMIWNSHILCLALGATLVLYDGSFTGRGQEPNWLHLWQLADRLSVTQFGAGAAFYQSCLKAEIEPYRFGDFGNLRSVGSTGSPLSGDAHDWIYRAVKADLWVKISSGGTDICAPFLGGVPTLPVYRGEMQCRVLGAAVNAYDDAGRPVLKEVGELVCERPLPSMPLFFWGDGEKRRYLESYFETFVGADGRRIWRHGDWMKLVSRPDAVGAIIYGRSDATINRQGVRMGSADIYRTVEAFDEIVDSLVVDLEFLGRDSYMALFVVLRSGNSLSPELIQRLKQSIRDALSPRHVPNEIIAAPEVPRTITGKKLEVPVKRLLLGHPVEKVASRDSIANPLAFDWFVALAKSRGIVASNT